MLGNRVLAAIEELSVRVHQGDFSNELVPVLVLVALALVFHVAKRNRVFNHVFVRGTLLLRHLIVVNAVLVDVPHFLNDFHEDLIESLVACLLALALALGVHAGLHLVIEVFLAESERFKP